MATFTSMLYRAARLSASGRAVRRSVQTGSPYYVARRARNIAIGRTMARAGVWRALWK
jgi:type IV secretory pathway TrbF-like protein